MSLIVDFVTDGMLSGHQKNQETQGGFAARPFTAYGGQMRPKQRTGTTEEALCFTAKVSPAVVQAIQKEGKITKTTKF